MPSKQKAIIIGCGVAGLACAARLAVQGFEVDVFEKNSYPGGKLYAFEKEGYHFDAGPSVFIQPENLESLFNVAGEDIHHYLAYKQVDITCKYFYEDGTIINAYSDIQKFANELHQKTGEPPQHVVAYLKEAGEIYNNIGRLFLEQSLHKTKGWKRIDIAKALLHTKAGYLFSSLHKANAKHFYNAHVVQLFNRYATYNGSNPYQAPAMLKLISQLELNKGVFYPQGGMMAINNALYKLALNKGVKFYFNAPVQQIIQTDNKATGIVVNNEKFLSDVVVSNADVYFTYLHLLNNKTEAAKILKQQRSSSAIVFYWGIKKEFPQLELHNIFFSKDYKAEFESIFHSKTVYEDPTIYINITSKYQPGVHAPQAKENWFVMVNVASGKSMSDALAIQSYKKNIVAKLSRILQTNVEALIETETVLHPQKIEEETNSFAGAVYGTSSNSRNAAFLRHPNFSKHIKGLYFAGGTVHPGGGIPLCLKSAAITSNIIAQDFKNSKQHE